jgi:glycosyltransferase involved in cell wall biosynthesis
MEAMAKGLPVIATRVAGVSELVRDGETGFVLPPGSVDHLAEAIGELSRRREQLDAMRAAARRIVVEEFSVRVQGPQMEALFKQYLERPAGSTP